MKDELSCNIVQDLLPNFIEKLTSNETNHAIEQHLAICEDCKNVYEQMNSDIRSTVKVPVIELKFLKKIKRTRKLAALLTIILTLVLSYMLYCTEFKYTNDKNVLAVGVTEFLSQHSINAYIFETKEIDGTLIATFKDQARTNVNGVATLVKGFNRKYRIISAKIDTSGYSSVLQIYPIKIKDKRYYIVSGYNLSDKIKYYGLDYHAYKNPGDLSKDRVRVSIKFDVKNQQFIEAYSSEYIEKLYNESIKDILYNPRLVSTSTYNINGMEITEDFKINEDIGNPIKASISKAELSMIYISMFAVMELGFILTKFFLTD